MGEMGMKSNRVLVCAPRVPEFDREGGSRRVFHLIQFFLRAGWAVTVAANDGSGGRRYVRTLQQMGVVTYALKDGWSEDKHELIAFDQLIAAGAFDLVLFAFWYCAEPYIERVRALAGPATIVVDSIDVHFLRQSRKVFTDELDHGRLDEAYADQMRREVNVYAAADAVLTVSNKEAQLVDDLVGRSLAHAIPDMEDIELSPVSFAARRGILFVGNFRHPPNVQAVEYLCRRIVPRLPASLLAEHPVYIVGNDAPASVVQCCRETGHVRLVGWVPSVIPYLHRSRISVIPLLHGAGTKRKLMQSLMAGTPSVSTSIGIEGLSLTRDVHVLVADEPDVFAASMRTLMQDEELWLRLADQGRHFIMQTHGCEAAYARWTNVLERVVVKRFPPPVFCEEVKPESDSGFDSELDRSTREDVLRSRRSTGFCNISGAQTHFIVGSENLREDIIATVSSSKNRDRQLICAMSIGTLGHPQGSLAEIVDRWNRSDSRVYIAEVHSVLSAFLRERLRPELLVCSEYFGLPHKSGELVNGILHQDLQHTSFEDALFDVVITADVFEHIPDAVAAEAEVMRILKPGGAYYFTVPFVPSDEDIVLADVDENGATRYFAEPHFHNDPLRPEGILVYRIFSFGGMKRRFEGMGHEFKTFRLWSKELGILGDACYAHVVRKR